MSHRSSLPGRAHHVIGRSDYLEENSLDQGRLAVLRQETYQLLAAMLLYPEEQLLSEAPAAARRIRDANRWAAVMAYYNTWDRFLRRVGELTLEQLPDLQNKYLTLFGSSNLRRPIPLCESGYLDQSALTSGEVIASLEQEYATAGLSVSSVTGESPDHVTVQLEFTAFLCAREVLAWKAHDLSSALEAVEGQERFIREHTSQWLPLLARAIASRMDEGLYLITALTAETMVIHDVDFLKALTRLSDAEVL